MQENRYAYPILNWRFYFITALIVVLFAGGFYYFSIDENGYKFLLLALLVFVVVKWGGHYLKLLRNFLHTPYLIVKEKGMDCYDLFDHKTIKFDWQDVLYSFF